MKTTTQNSDIILAIVPAYNEEKNIIQVIDSIKAVNKNYDIVVVNDHSTDRTEKFAESTRNATVINLPINLGIGGAVQTGFKYAKNNDYKYAFQFDGDGQHNATEIEKILNPVEQGICDVAIGSRFIKKQKGIYQSTFFRRIGIKIFEIVNSLLIKQRITDNTSGFRAYNRKAITFLAENYPTDYPEPEAIVLLKRNSFKLKEVPVTMKKRIGGKSSIAGFQPIYYMIKVILAILFASIRAPKIKE